MIVNNVIYNSLRSWRDLRPSARALFMANGREREPRSREGIGASRQGIGEESSIPPATASYANPASRTIPPATQAIT